MKYIFFLSLLLIGCQPIGSPMPLQDNIQSVDQRNLTSPLMAPPVMKDSVMVPDDCFDKGDQIICR